MNFDRYFLSYRVFFANKNIVNQFFYNFPV